MTALIWVTQTEWFAVFKSGDMEQIQLLLQEKTTTIIFLTFFLMMIQNVLTLIPIVGIIVINIALFGFVYGYIWSVLTSVIAGALGFVVFRYWFQSILTKKVPNVYLNRLENNGFWFVLFLRMIPFIPSSFINLAGGVSSISLTAFFIATLIGNGIYLLLLSFVADGLLTAEIEGYILVALVLALIPSFYFYRLLKQKVKIEENQKKKVSRG
ncbi:TVP38/TMEM64 family protein [Sutcliffiella rhizosphaerae]|uniref:TVP38/TMEM64 family membrane protein n=1 Tax=Sutcliffiella rhizosphaerae TaxID=2880967 RepID=A0ABN8AB90_9BACI|nr:VTT domain-containing protein [Sutcliffiella rhizosphaerae]CAG9621739.1 hypothetical protein BACCIP111883_02512 [Sutcliffiella rhizosphaerae]